MSSVISFVISLCLILQISKNAFSKNLQTATKHGLALWVLGALVQQNSLHQNGSLSCRNGSFGQTGSCWGLGSIARWGKGGQAMPIAFGFTKMEVPFRSSFRKASWAVFISKISLSKFYYSPLTSNFFDSCMVH